MKKILLPIIILLGGCTSQQIIKEDSFKEETNKILFEEIEKLKNKKSYEEINVKLVNFKEEEAFKDKKISFDFVGNSTIQDFIDILDYYNITVIASQDIDTTTALSINKYNGDLKNLLNGISKNTNISFEYRNNILYFIKEKNYELKTIQDIDILNSIYEQLSKIEIKELIKNENAALISFKSDYKTYEKIKRLINEINNNTSLISIDLSIINVKLEESNGNGFDFESLNIAANFEPTEILEKTLSLTSGKKLSFSNKNINASAVLNILDTYGTSEVLQNTSIKTISGKEATFSTLEKNPYISNVSTTTNGDFANTGFTTEETETGLNLTILPFYDRDLKIVNAKVDLTKSSLKDYFTFYQNDTELKQPITEEQNFKSVVRLTAGETNVIGGLIYYSKKMNGNAINGFKKITQSNNSELEKNALFIVLKVGVKAYVYK